MNFDGFVGGAYLARSPNQDVERLVNMYVEVAESPGAKAKAMLLGTPGLSLWLTLPAAGGVRGLYTAANGRCFAVCGATLYELLPGALSVARGTLASTSGVVSMADNGLELALVDGTPTGGWSLRLADNLFRLMAGAGFLGSTRVAFFDGYFVFAWLGTQQVGISGLYDATTAAPLDFASAESSPDLNVAFEVERRELLILGSRSGEVWFNAGTADFPLAPIAGTAFPYGCAAAHSLRALGAFYWLATDQHGALLVVHLDGYAPKRCSTHAVEFALSTYDRVDDAMGYTMHHEGHTWYVLNFPSGNATWCYDLSTKLWCEFSDLDASSGLFKRHRVEHHAYAFGKHLVAGALDGRVYESSMEVFDNAGDPLVRERTAPHLHNDRKIIYHSVFELDLQTGVGLDAGAVPGRDPQILLQWSDDGGRTWSSEHWTSAGTLGAYLTRAIWRRLGRSRQRAYRVRISDPVRVAILAARIEVS